jgi:hypothetical protein
LQTDLQLCLFDSPTVAALDSAGQGGRLGGAQTFLDLLGSHQEGDQLATLPESPLGLAPSGPESLGGGSISRASSLGSLKRGCARIRES